MYSRRRLGAIRVLLLVRVNELAPLPLPLPLPIPEAINIKYQSRVARRLRIPVAADMQARLASSARDRRLIDFVSAFDWQVDVKPSSPSSTQLRN